jgi:hypothetical protein
MCLLRSVVLTLGSGKTVVFDHQWQSLPSTSRVRTLGAHHNGKRGWTQHIDPRLTPVLNQNGAALVSPPEGW